MPDLRSQEGQTDGGKFCPPGEQSARPVAVVADEAVPEGTEGTQARKKTPRPNVRRANQSLRKIESEARKNGIGTLGEFLPASI